MTTRARRDGDAYVLDGAKLYIHECRIRLASSWSGP
jgi:alkylation response protein AidB-like acyl-CoA dehydrogenase